MHLVILGHCRLICKFYDLFVGRSSSKVHDQGDLKKNLGQRLIPNRSRGETDDEELEEENKGFLRMIFGGFKKLFERGKNLKPKHFGFDSSHGIVPGLLVDRDEYRLGDIRTAHQKWKNKWIHTPLSVMSFGLYKVPKPTFGFRKTNTINLLDFRRNKTLQMARSMTKKRFEIVGTDTERRELNDVIYERKQFHKPGGFWSRKLKWIKGLFPWNWKSKQAKAAIKHKEEFDAIQQEANLYEGTAYGAALTHRRNDEGSKFWENLYYQHEECLHKNANAINDPDSHLSPEARANYICPDPNEEFGMNVDGTLVKMSKGDEHVKTVAEIESEHEGNLKEAYAEHNKQIPPASFLAIGTVGSTLSKVTRTHGVIEEDDMKPGIFKIGIKKHRTVSGRGMFTNVEDGTQLEAGFAHKHTSFASFEFNLGEQNSANAALADALGGHDHTHSASSAATSFIDVSNRNAIRAQLNNQLVLGGIEQSAPKHYLNFTSERRAPDCVGTASGRQQK